MPVCERASTPTRSLSTHSVIWSIGIVTLTALPSKVADIVCAFGEHLQKVDKRAVRRELNERFHGFAVTKPSDFLLRDPQAKRVTLNTKFHKRPNPITNQRSDDFPSKH